MQRGHPAHAGGTSPGARLMLDTYREVVTPEGVGLHLPAAGPVPRALAWGIDLAIRLGIVLVMAMFLALLGKVGQGLHLIVMFLVFWAYPIVLESVWRGQTPGKKALGLRVVAIDGAPVGPSSSFQSGGASSLDLDPIDHLDEKRLSQQRPRLVRGAARPHCLIARSKQHRHPGVDGGGA